MRRKILFSFLGLLTCAWAPLISTPIPLPTYTPRPTYTALPTYTLPAPTPYPTATILPVVEEIQETSGDSSLSESPVYITVTPYILPTGLIPAAMDEEMQCGDEIGISLTYMLPKVQATLSEHFPIGRFLLVRVKLRSLTGMTIQPLQSKSFTMLGSLWGRDVTVSLDRENSNYANTRWEIPNLDYTIGSVGIETFLIFDIHPEMTNFELLFTPYSAGADEPSCEMRIPLRVEQF